VDRRRTAVVRDPPSRGLRFRRLEEADFAALASPPPDWIAFGTLIPCIPNARQLLRSVMQRFPHARRFYDINLRRDSYTPELSRASASSPRWSS
jgi:hypothetical protein